MVLLLGLIAALSLGVGDFLARLSSERVGAYQTLLYVQPLGLAGLSIYWIVAGLSLKPADGASQGAWVWAGVVVILNLLSALAFYRALRVGTVSIISPIVASYAAITVLLSVLAGERLSLNAGLGAGAILVGVALTATAIAPTATQLPDDGQQKKPIRWPRGIGLALTASLGYGVATWLLGTLVTPQLGAIAPVWLIRFMTPCLLVAGAISFHQPIRLPSRSAWWCIGGVGLFDTVGYIAGLRGLATGQIALVGVLISLFSPVTILLAMLFLGERLLLNQWLGVGIIFVGLVMVDS